MVFQDFGSRSRLRDRFVRTLYDQRQVRQDLVVPIDANAILQRYDSDLEFQQKLLQALKDHESGIDRDLSGLYDGGNAILLIHCKSLEDQVADFLESINYRVIRAADQDDALQKIYDSPLDVMISYFPTINPDTGLEDISQSKDFFREVSRDEGMLPVIYLTVPSMETFGALSDGLNNNAGRIDIADPEGQLSPQGILELETMLSRAVHNDTYGSRARLNIHFKRLADIWDAELAYFDSIREFFKFTQDSFNILDLAQRRRDFEEIFMMSHRLSNWLNQRIKMPDLGGRIVGMREDSAIGVASVPILRTIEPERIYEPGFFSCVAKPVSNGELYFTQAMLDLVLYGQGRNPFPLARPLKYSHSLLRKEGVVLFEMSIAPPNAHVMAVLDPRREFDNRVISSIVSLSNDVAVDWFKRTTPNVLLPSVSLEEAIDAYRAKTVEALSHAMKRTDVKFTDEEISAFNAYLVSRLDLTHNHPGFFGRIIDNSPNNSGLALGIMRPGRDYILSSVGAILEEKFGSTAELAYSSKDTIEDVLWELWRTWDQYMGVSEDGNFQPRNILEDFFAMTDSYEAKRHEYQKCDHYVRFMGSLMQWGAAGNQDINGYWSDFLIVGFYRNLRKADLVMSTYMVNNETDFQNLKINSGVYFSKQEEYFRKWKHYLQQAEKYAVLEALVDPEFVKNNNSKHVIWDIFDVAHQYIAEGEILQKPGLGSRTVAEVHASPLYSAVVKIRNANLVNAA